MPEEMKSKCKQQLKDCRTAILNSTDPCALRNQVESLKKILENVSESYTGEVNSTAQIAMEKIKKIELYDVTRFEVCRWVQTLICELN